MERLRGADGKREEQMKRGRGADGERKRSRWIERTR